MKSIKAKLQTRNPGGGLLGAELTELAKAATAKDVPQPDEDLNQMVIDAISSNSESSAYTQVRDVLHKRMNMKNPHKVWLATHLAEDILKKCTDTIGPIRSDIYQDLAAIAGKPLDRYQVNFKDEQRAKMHAFAVLRSTKQGQSVLRHTLKMGRMVSLTPAQNSGKSQQRVRLLNANGEPSKPERTDSGSEKAEKKPEAAAAADSPKSAANGLSRGAVSANDSSRGGTKSGGEASGRGKRSKMTFEEAKTNVTNALGVAGSHTSMIQDLVINIADGKSEAPEFERQFLGDLAEEVISFRTAFEQLVSGLMSFKKEEADPLVQQALEAVDDMNNALALCKDVTDNLPPAAEAAPSSNSPRPAGASAAGASSRGRSSSALGGGRTSGSGAGRASRGESASGRRSPLHQYAPAATASRGYSDPKGLDSSIAALGLGQGKGRSKSSKETNGSRGSRPPMQRAHSTGQTDPLLPVAGMQQPQFSQLGLPGSQPQSFFQGPVYYPPQGQQSMPYAPMAQQPVLYMPVTGPNGEQGFAPVVVPPGSQMPMSSVFPAGGQFPPSGQMPMPMPMSGGSPAGGQMAASGAFPAGGQMPASGSISAGSTAMYQPPYAPSAAAQPVNGQQSGGQPTGGAAFRVTLSAAAAGSPAQHNGRTNPFAPATNGSGAVHAAAAAHESDVDGGMTDSESEVPHIISSSSLGSPFKAGSREQLGGGAIPHVVSASSDIFPAESASGVLAGAGLTKFAPATAPAPESQLQQSAPLLVPQAAEQRKPAAANGEAAGKFDKVFEELVQ